MKCKICGNSDESYFYLGSKGYYCRRCIEFRYSLLDQDLDKYDIELPLDYEYSLGFDLTADQKYISKQLLDNYLDNNLLVWAVCGAGKTEIVLQMIKDAFSRGLRVGWAIPRRSVVVQLHERLCSYFPHINISLVCQGHHEDIFQSFVVCTTHQLYNFSHYFDLLIIDEPDAFPFKGNELLQDIALNSCQGKIVYLSATPDQFVFDHVDHVFELNSRPFNNKLIVPREYRVGKVLGYMYLFWLVNKLIKKRQPLLVFMPTIKLANELNKVMRLFYRCDVITSHTDNKELIIERLIDGSVDFLLTTTILERGVTIKGVNIIVFNADHQVFDMSSLIQIVGRVGRSRECLTGDACLITFRKDSEVVSCIDYLLKVNKSV
ncbi:MAG: helicase-related protein [Erysipelotrichaceae bacterium]